MTKKQTPRDCSESLRLLSASMTTNYTILKNTYLQFIRRVLVDSNVNLIIFLHRQEILQFGIYPFYFQANQFKKWVKLTYYRISKIQLLYKLLNSNNVTRNFLHFISTLYGLPIAMMAVTISEVEIRIKEPCVSMISTKLNSSIDIDVR